MRRVFYLLALLLITSCNLITSGEVKEAESKVDEKIEVMEKRVRPEHRGPRPDSMRVDSLRPKRGPKPEHKGPRPEHKGPRPDSIKISKEVK